MSTALAEITTPAWRLKDLVVRRATVRLIAIIVFLFVWDVTARSFGDPRFIVPPMVMIESLPGLFQVRGVPLALATTFIELIAAFGLSVCIGAPVGLWLGLNSTSRRRLSPIVLFLYGIPQITMLPLLVMILGVGAGSKITFGVTHAVFPIIFTISAAAQNLDQTLNRYALVHGASRGQMLWYLTLPQIVPALFVSMRLAMVGALLGVLLAELYVTMGGIGYYTRLFSDSFQTGKLYALVFLLAAMAVALNELLRIMEKTFSRWRTA